MNTFRKAYRELSDDEKQLLDRIKDQAQDLLDTIESAEPGRERSLAITKLEETVMWAVKGITG